jgi:predicted DNA binding protein
MARKGQMYVLSADIVHDRDWTTALEKFENQEVYISSLNCNLISENYDSETILVRSRSKSDYSSLIADIKTNPLVRQVDYGCSIGTGHQKYYVLTLTAKSDISSVKCFSQCGAIFLSARYVAGLEHWKFLCDKRQINLLSEMIRNISSVIRLEMTPASPEMLETGMPMSLSPMEFHSLTTGYQMGYFEFPRRCSLVDVSHRLSISKGTLNEYIRKGIHKIMAKEMSDVWTN